MRAKHREVYLRWVSADLECRNGEIGQPYPQRPHGERRAHARGAAGPGDRRRQGEHGDRGSRAGKRRSPHGDHHQIGHAHLHYHRAVHGIQAGGDDARPRLTSQHRAGPLC